MQIAVGEYMSKYPEYGAGFVIAIFSTKEGPYLIWANGRGFDGWPPIMINPVCIDPFQNEIFEPPHPHLEIDDTCNEESKNPL